MAEQNPSIGRVVHFVYGVFDHYAAIITHPSFLVQGEGQPDWYGQALIVFPPNEAPFTTVAAFDPAAAPATWHWPEFVPPKA